MAFNAGTLVATIQLDGKGKFDSDLDSSGRKFSQTSALAQKAGQAVSAALKGAAVATGVATVASAAYVASLFKTGVAYNQLQQQSRAALSTLLGGAVQANAQMDKLDEFARTSPFAKSVFITAQQQLLGFGLQAEKVIPALTAIQDAVAAVGGSNEQISQITYALAQMRGQGKLTGETLNQLGQFGIDAAGLIGAKMGKTGAEIRDMASSPGGIPVDEVWDPLVSALEDKFGGAAANVKNTFTGTLDRIKAASRDVGAALAEPFVGKNGGGAAVTWGNQVADVLRAVQSKVAPVVSIITGRAQPAFEGISDVLIRAKNAVNGWDPSKLESLLDKASKYAPAIAGVGGAVVAMNSGFLGSIPILGSFIPKINPAAAAITGIALASPEARDALKDVLDAVQPLIPVLGNLVKLLARDLTTILPGVSSGLESVVDVARPFLELISQTPPALVLAVAGFVAFKNIQQPLAEGLLNAGINIEGFLDHLGPVGGKLGGVVDAFQGAATFLSGPWGLAIGGAAALIGGSILDDIGRAAQRVDQYTESLDKNTGALTKNTRADAVKNLHDNGAIELANKLGVNLDVMTDAALGNTDAVQQIIDAQKEWAKQSNLSDAELTQGSILWQELESKIGGATGEIGKSQRDFINQAKAMGVLRDAQNAYKTDLDAATQSIATNGATLDSTTAAGQANQAALDALALSSQGVLNAMAAQGAGSDAIQAKYDQEKQKLYDVAAQMGLTGAAADDYVKNHLNLIPSNKNTDVTLTGVSAVVAAAQAIIDRTAQIQRVIDISVRLHGAENLATTGGLNIANADGNLYSAGAAMSFANGGLPSGIYRGGRPIYKFAEPETRWEAFISGKVGQEARNRRILAEAGARLGMMVVPTGSRRPTAFANGAMLGGSGAQAARASSPSIAGLRIAGTLDMGNGLVGFVRGVIEQESSISAAEVNAGSVL